MGRLKDRGNKAEDGPGIFVQAGPCLWMMKVERT